MKLKKLVLPLIALAMMTTAMYLGAPQRVPAKAPIVVSK